MSVRFAPSPTGHFHFGNLRTAWISSAFARELKMPWIVRFEDIDRPRVQPGAMEHQLSELRALGLEPDQIQIQSSNHRLHERFFELACRSSQVYPCTCSRKEIQDHLERMPSAPHGEWPIYDGRCRDEKSRPPARHPSLAWRFRNPAFPDGSQDFIIGRTDEPRGANQSVADLGLAIPAGGFVPAYHWACAIDDHQDRHALLIRAWDLAPAIPIQRAIHAWLNSLERDASARSFPAVFHTSLVTASDGHRLEKRTQGVRLPELLAQGESSESLISKMSASFNPAHFGEYAEAKVWGEARETIPIQAILGI